MIKCFLLLLMSTSALAAPQQIEVWLVSNRKVADLNRLLNRPYYVMRAPTAELACQEMGDYCFDPQVGLYKKDDVTTRPEIEEVVEKQIDGLTPKGTLDRDLISCDPKNFFDVFCGKARKEPARSVGFELWIDTSGSMKEFDFSDASGGCFRKSMVARLDAKCGFNQQVNVMTFDTSIRQASSMNDLCNSQGLNDYKRLIDWIERSEARRLVIITDIYELQKEFADYIESKNGIFRGDKDPMTAAQLLGLVEHLEGLCR